jgi:hypothetical protein
LVLKEFPADRALSPTEAVAVIDIGSNSGRVVVFQRDTDGNLRALAGSRASLRLIEDVDRRGELTESTMARTTEALRDFKAIATGAGATRIVAWRPRRCATRATARSSRNGFSGSSESISTSSAARPKRGTASPEPCEDWWSRAGYCSTSAAAAWS